MSDAQVFSEAKQDLASGQSLQARGDYEAAIAAYHHGIQILSDRYSTAALNDDTGMKLVLAKSNEEKGNLQSAAAVYERVLGSRINALAEKHPNLKTGETNSGKPMDSDTAYRLIADWRIDEGLDPQDFIERQANGDFYGEVATLYFQFDNATQNLMVRGRVLPDSAGLVKYHDIMPVLDRIAREEPERVSHAQFDFVRTFRDDKDENPSLYLRRDYTEASAPTHKLIRALSRLLGRPNGEATLFEEWRKLRETAYVWHRAYLAPVLGPIAERRQRGEDMKASEAYYGAPENVIIRLETIYGIQQIRIMNSSTIEITRDPRQRIGSVGPLKEIVPVGRAFILQDGSHLKLTYTLLGIQGRCVELRLENRKPATVRTFFTEGVPTKGSEAR